MPGMRTSMITTSGRASRTAAMPASPEEAVRVSKPSAASNRSKLMRN